MRLENFERFAGVVASIFGQQQDEILRGDFTRAGLDPETIEGSRWIPAVTVTRSHRSNIKDNSGLQINLNRRWLGISREHI